MNSSEFPERGLGRKAPSTMLLTQPVVARSRVDKLKFWKPPPSAAASAASKPKPTWRILTGAPVLVNIGTSFVRFLSWSFRAHFLLVLLATIVYFVINVCIYASLIYALRGCLSFGDGDSKATFMDAYHLSWTTFSTVGYGLIGPDVGSSNPICMILNAVMALEAFAGVLFSSMMGAVIFAKIARVQSIANVVFSSSLCIRYGPGVCEDNDEGGDSDNGEENKEEDKAAVKKNFPILEFRIVNLLQNYTQGEIMDASVSVIACVLGKDEDKEQTAIKERSRASKRRKRLKGGNSQDSSRKGSMLTSSIKGTTQSGSIIQRIHKSILRHNRPQIPEGIAFENVPTDVVTPPPILPYHEEKRLEKELQAALQEKIVERIIEETKTASQQCIEVNEGNDKLAPPRKYHKLDIETNCHPNFTRSWVIRHEMNGDSPLLNLQIRREIEKNGGVWPETLNDPTVLRQILRFRDIIVVFSGTANASGSSVYAQKIYSMNDLLVGFTFAQTVEADQLLADTVKVQKGGGAEAHCPPVEEVKVDAQKIASFIDEIHENTDSDSPTASEVVDNSYEIHV